VEHGHSKIREDSAILGNRATILIGPCFYRPAFVQLWWIATFVLVVVLVVLSRGLSARAVIIWVIARCSGWW
jgi:hypothetical protein